MLPRGQPLAKERRKATNANALMEMAAAELLEVAAKSLEVASL